MVWALLLKYAENVETDEAKVLSGTKDTKTSRLGEYVAYDTYYETGRTQQTRQTRSPQQFIEGLSLHLPSHFTNSSVFYRATVDNLRFLWVKQPAERKRSTHSLYSSYRTISSATNTFLRSTLR